MQIIIERTPASNGALRADLSGTYPNQPPIQYEGSLQYLGTLRLVFTTGGDDRKSEWSADIIDLGGLLDMLLEHHGGEQLLFDAMLRKRAKDKAVANRKAAAARRKAA